MRMHAIEKIHVGFDLFDAPAYAKKKVAVTKGEAPAYLMKGRSPGRRDEPERGVSVPVLAIYPNRVVSYNEVDRIWQRSLVGIQDENRKPANDTRGEISKAANKRIMNAVNWLYYLSKEKTTEKKTINGPQFYKFRVNFITLTLPSEQRHDDKYIKSEMLNAFLEWMRYNGVKSYIWKAEPQKNGFIHFHITTNVFLDWKFIREKWNEICAKHGYIEPYHQKFKGCSLAQYIDILKKDGFKPEYNATKRAWERGTAENWLNPNSTDVHSTKKVRKMAAYMAKYMTKKSEVHLVKWVKDVSEADKHPIFKNRDRSTDLFLENGLVRVYIRRVIQGRQWFLSTNLSQIKAPVVVAAGCEALESDFKVLQTLKSTLFKVYDYASVMYYDYRDAIKAKCTSFIDELIELAFKMSPAIN